MNRSVIIGMLLYLIGQVTTWYQGNLQFINSWAKDNPLVLALAGIPVSYTFILANKYTVEGVGGELWPSRLIGFAIGMGVMGVLTYLHLNQVVTLKTVVTLLLALVIVLIQIFWK